MGNHTVWSPIRRHHTVRNHTIRKMRHKSRRYETIRHGTFRCRTIPCVTNMGSSTTPPGLETSGLEPYSTTQHHTIPNVPHGTIPCASAGNIRCASAATLSQEEPRGLKTGRDSWLQPKSPSPNSLIQCCFIWKRIPQYWQARGPPSGLAR